MADVLVGAVLAVLVALAVRKIYRDRLLGRCGGDCDACATGCGRRRKDG